MDSFETRYSYFLGQSPNFVLFRILKFGFSDFLWIFIKIHWNCYFSYIFQWIPLKLGTHTYFLGQSPNFVLFRILKFEFSDFLWIFIKIHWNCYFSYIFQWILLKLGTLISWVRPQTLFFSEFWNLDFLIFFNEFSSNFHWNRYCSYSFQWIPLQLGTLILWVFTSSFQIFEICIFLFLGRIFIQVSFKSVLLLQYLMDS